MCRLWYVFYLFKCRFVSFVRPSSCSRVKFPLICMWVSQTPPASYHLPSHCPHLNSVISPLVHCYESSQLVTLHPPLAIGQSILNAAASYMQAGPWNTSRSYQLLCSKSCRSHSESKPKNTEEPVGSFLICLPIPHLSGPLPPWPQTSPPTSHSLLTSLQPLAPRCTRNMLFMLPSRVF